MRILLTSAGTATCVNLIKYLKKHGDYIVVTDINPVGYTSGSLLADRFYQVPLAIENGFVRILNEIIVKEIIELLIPINDIEVYCCSKNINEIKCQCIVPNISTIEKIRDKYVCSRQMSNIGIMVPEILSTDDITKKRILRDRLGVGSKGIIFFEKGEKCGEYLKEKSFLQRCIEGKEYTIDVLADKKGYPIYIVPRERLEIKNGVATQVYVLEDMVLINSVKLILQEFILPGFSNMQFIKDGYGRYWLIEINYRFSGCGAATLAVCPDYIVKLRNVINDVPNDTVLNADVKWKSIVTRYYEEVVYEESIC